MAAPVLVVSWERGWQLTKLLRLLILHPGWLLLLRCWPVCVMNLRQAVVAIVGPLQTHFLLNTLVIYALSLPALIELHISRALLHAVDVAHELGSAGGLHLAEELHGAAGHLLTNSKAGPGILRLAPAEHELIVLHLTVLAQVHCCRPQGGCSQGHLLHSELLLGR